MCLYFCKKEHLKVPKENDSTNGFRPLGIRFFSVLAIQKNCNIDTVNTLQEKNSSHLIGCIFTK